MQKAVDRKTAPLEQRKGPMKKSDSLEAEDHTRLNLLLMNGFAVACSYQDMSRDRWHVELADKVTVTELYTFLGKYLRGTPIPGHDPMADGPKSLALFKIAEKAGLVSLTYVRADLFIPEAGRE
jgi:hypothetical protein